MSNNQKISLKSSLEKFPFWAKFVAIMHFITGGFSILGIITIPIGIFYILAGIKLWDGANMATNIIKKDEDTLVDQDTLNLINSYKDYNKNLGIATIINFITVILIFIFYIVIIFLILGFSFAMYENSEKIDTPEFFLEESTEFDISEEVPQLESI